MNTPTHTRARRFAAAMIVAVSLPPAALPAPAAAQTVLDKLIARMGRPRAGSGGTAASAPAPLGGFAAAITPAQSAAVDRLLAQPLQDRGIAADRGAAAPLIRTVLAVGACATAPEAWLSVNRYHLTPSDYRYLTSLVPMSGLRYHDAGRCLDVVRLTDWARLAANAIRFRAYYLAGDSGEARNQEFELQRTSEGQWMIRSIGAVS